MAAVVGALRADLETNVATFKKQMNEGGDAVDKTAGRMKRAGRDADVAGKKFSDFGKMVKFSIGSLAGFALVDFARRAVNGAIEGERFSRRMTGTFTEMGKSAEAWSNTTARALARDDELIKQVVLEFGVLGQAMFKTQGEAVDMSKAMTRLAVDLAELKGKTVEEAATALSKGLAGSTRGLKEFGILISDQEVQQKAIAMGLAKTTKEITAQDKALAMYQVILEKTAGVQGYAETQLGTSEAKMRAFMVQIDDLAESLGHILLPPLMEVTKWFSLYAKGIQTLLGDTHDFNQGLLMLELRWAQMTGGDLKPIVDKWKAMNGGMDDAARSAATLGGELGDTFTAIPLTQEEINKRAREAEKTLQQYSRQVRDFGVNTLPTSIQMQTKFADSFNDVQDSIVATIAAIREKDDATEAELRLATQLGWVQDELRKKYEGAAAAAERLYEATLRAQDAQTAVDVSGIQDTATDLATASGRMGLVNDAQQRALELERRLNAERLRTVATLMDLEKQRAEAELNNDDMALDRIQALTDANTQYYDLLQQTSAQQIMAQDLLLRMVEDWQQATSRTIGDFIKDFRDTGMDNAKEIAANFFRAISDSVIDRKADELATDLLGFLGIGQGAQNVGVINAGSIVVASTALGGAAGAAAGAMGGGGGGFMEWIGGAAKGATDWLGGLFSSFGGFFADGGRLGAGEWGIAGEDGPELIRGGVAGLNVMPIEGGGGGDVNQAFYITTPNPDGFRQSRRQIGQMARRELG